MKPQLIKSYSSFTNNDAFKREEQIRRDNDIVRTPSVTLYDVDYGDLRKNEEQSSGISE